MAHIGVIEALKERGIEPRVVSGSSVGALVGALYANGNSAEDMLSFFKETPLFRYNFLAISKPGLIDTDKYISIFKRYFPADSFESLEKELHVVATDLQNGEERYFNQGQLILPLLASAALPPVFSPVDYDGVLYADGGIMNNFPIEPVIDRVDYTLGSNVSIVSQLKGSDLKNAIQLTGRVTGLMIYAINRKKLERCNLVFEAKALEKIGLLDRRGIEKAYTIGYEDACRLLDKLPA